MARLSETDINEKAQAIREWIMVVGYTPFILLGLVAFIILHPIEFVELVRRG